MLDVMRAIQQAMHQPAVHKLFATVSPEVGFQLLNRKRSALTQLEQDLGKRLVINMGSRQGRDAYELAAEDARGRGITLSGEPPPITASAATPSAPPPPANREAAR
jgi:hypothetical protein